MKKVALFCLQAKNCKIAALANSSDWVLRHLFNFCRVEQLLRFQQCEIRLLTPELFNCLASFGSLCVWGSYFYQVLSNSPFSGRAQICSTGIHLLSVSLGHVSADISLSLPTQLFSFWVLSVGDSQSNSRKIITEVQNTWDWNLIVSGV